MPLRWKNSFLLEENIKSAGTINSLADKYSEELLAQYEIDCSRDLLKAVSLETQNLTQGPFIAEVADFNLKTQLKRLLLQMHQKTRTLLDLHAHQLHNPQAQLTE